MTRSEEILNLSGSFGGETFESKLKVLHEVLLSRLEFVDRLAIAIYDPATDLLKTFASSNRGNPPLRAYEARLADVPSLQRLADTHSARVVNDIAATHASGSAHSRWLREQGFQSSFTLPIYFGAQLAGFAFMDSRRPEAFAESTISFVGSFAQLASQLYLSQVASARGLIGSVQIASRLASIRDVETGVHLERIAKYARLIARGLVRKGHPLSDEFVEYVHLFAPLHDIGKVGIPDRILLKPGSLDTEEFALMQTHVELGLRMVEEMAIDIGLADTEAARIMRNVVATHHERGDGSGYPKGLKSEQIPLEGRIVAVADVFDALSTPRPYKRAWAFEDCAQHLRELGAAGRLDPDCVQALLADPEELYRIQRQFAEPEHALAAH
jgi:HD-GYP domain-containing protein (c-di-GMP phosphodiesterase class II)